MLGAQFVQSVAWGLSISGATHLNLQRIISDSVVVRLDLVSGRSLSGVLLKVDKSEQGTELYLRSVEGDLLIVPYHAMTVASVPGEILNDVASDDDVAF